MSKFYSTSNPAYGTDPRKTEFWETATTVESPGQGGGFPWFKSGKSPTYPTGQGQTPPNATDQLPPESQGPPYDGPIGGVGGGMLGNLTSKDLMALIASLMSTAGALKTNQPNAATTSGTTDPAMNELIALMQGRLRKSEPMFDSVQAMANGMLPTAYQNGGKGR